MERINSNKNEDGLTFLILFFMPLAVLRHFNTFNLVSAVQPRKLTTSTMAPLITSSG